MPEAGGGLRDAAGRQEVHVRLARARRAAGLGALLHIGHHRLTEGRALQPSVNAAAHHGVPVRRRHRDARARRLHAGGADVPCQRLGLPLCRPAGRGRAGAALPADRSGEPGRADRGCRRHHGNGSAHGMARRPRRASQRPAGARADRDAEAHPDGRRGGERGTDRGLRDVRHRGHALLGHDRDLAARTGQSSKVRRSRLPRPPPPARRKDYRFPAAHYARSPTVARKRHATA